MIPLALDHGRRDAGESRPKADAVPLERGRRDVSETDRRICTDGGTPVEDDRATNPVDACTVVDSVAPDSLDELRAFLDEHADARAFDLSYWDARGDPRIVTGVEVVERTVRRPAAAVTLRCVGLPYGDGTVTIRFDDLARVKVVDAPDELFAVSGDTPAERAAAVADQARAAPAAVEVPTLVDLLETDDPAVREDALAALARVVEERPADCLPALPVLREFVSSGEHRTETLEVLESLADENPEDVAPLADEIAAHLDDADAGRAAASCLSSLAGDDPTDVVGAVPALTTVVEDGGPGRGYALYALNRVAGEYPEAVRPAAPALRSVVAADGTPSVARLNALAALGRVTAEHPDAALDAVEDLCGLVGGTGGKVRANAAGVLSDLATVHAGALVPHVDDLAPMLAADDDYTLVNASACLGRIAEVDPDAVRHLEDRFVELLDHDHELVRVNACWALGYLEAETALGRLDEARLHDDAAQVRNRAAWAIAEIEG